MTTLTKIGHGNCQLQEAFKGGGGGGRPREGYEGTRGRHPFLILSKKRNPPPVSQGGGGGWLCPEGKGREKVGPRETHRRNPHQNSDFFYTGG